MAIGSRPLADRLFRTALDLSDAREGALFVVLREPLRDASRLIATGDRLDLESPPALSEALSTRRQILRLLAGGSVLVLDASELAALALSTGRSSPILPACCWPPAPFSGTRPKQMATTGAGWRRAPGRPRRWPPANSGPF